ncbi:uncharacterized protein G2W53_022592 [Senna tora]|uniref:Uncharacterized protein n=1 Tax=Senna tora TaxID=362788 RepID=A0A834WKN2_9FABA|nr:uncharacterized protein G2W53_022592 [Senna tora]
MTKNSTTNASTLKVHSSMSQAKTQFCKVKKSCGDEAEPKATAKNVNLVKICKNFDIKMHCIAIEHQHKAKVHIP